MNKKLSGIHILLVEDDYAMLEVINDLLTQLGATTETAANGLIAWELIKKNKFDMIISDIQMPVMDGIQLLEKLRGLNTLTPPMILITGQAQITTKEAIAKGAIALLLKPFNIRSFTDLVVSSCS